MLSEAQVQRLEGQHARNVAQLARCYDRTRKNARYLKWFGWFPMAFVVRDAQRELDEATVELEQADAKLMALLNPTDSLAG